MTDTEKLKIAIDALVHIRDRIPDDDSSLPPFDASVYAEQVLNYLEQCDDNSFIYKTKPNYNYHID